MSHIQPDATKRTPQIKGVYIALISQAGTANPTITVIKNTLPTTGMPTWTRENTGIYRFTSANTLYFPTGLVTATITNNRDIISNSYVMSIIHGSQDRITILTGTGLGSATFTDAILAFTPIEITIWDRLQD